MSFRPVKLFEDQGYIEHQIPGIPFVERLPIPDGSKKLKTVVNGTTVRSVIKACISELDSLQRAMPCPQNVIAISHLEKALQALHEREADRRERGVEGYHLP